VARDEVELVRYAEADLWLTAALETDPDVMRELGGPLDPARLPETHRRRLEDPFWFTIHAQPGGAVGSIGIWEHKVDGEALHETGWMVLPAFQGRGIASRALSLLIERARATPEFEAMHAFPPVSNAPSNALCRKSGFTLMEEREFVYAGRTLRCNHWVLGVTGTQ
jgi:RimJ/RimL family protein N-acetyltransferase